MQPKYAWNILKLQILLIFIVLGKFIWIWMTYRCFWSLFKTYKSYMDILKSFKVKGVKEASFGVFLGCHESTPTFTSRKQELLSRVGTNLHDSARWEETRPFEPCCTLSAITPSTDVQIRWFKLHWKATQRPTTFTKKLLRDNIISMDKNTLKFTVSA